MKNPYVDPKNVLPVKFSIKLGADVKYALLNFVLWDKYGIREIVLVNLNVLEKIALLVKNGTKNGANVKYVLLKLVLVVKNGTKTLVAVNLLVVWNKNALIDRNGTDTLVNVNVEGSKTVDMEKLGIMINVDV